MSPQTRRMLLDFAPLVLFFIAYRLAGVYAATATVIVAATLSLVIGYAYERKVSPVPLATAILIAVLGGLTLYLKDATFIKMKPTFVYALLGAALIGGEVAGRPLIKHVFNGAIILDDAGWRGLSFRFGGFFLAMALLNELIWRTFSETLWVNYHTFGAIALTLLFAIAQAPYLMRHQIEPKPPEG